jgi:hypothetical protein
MTAGDAKAYAVTALAVARFGVQLLASSLVGVANALHAAELELIGGPRTQVRSAADIANEWANERAQAADGYYNDYGPPDGPPH